jgi:hypothetical protein
MESVLRVYRPALLRPLLQGLPQYGYNRERHLVPYPDSGKIVSSSWVDSVSVNI